MQKTFILILILLVCQINSLLAQQFEFVDSDQIRIIENNQTLSDPFSGGFNAVQIKEADIDNDGETEWIIYDRSNNKAYIGMMTDGVVKIDHNRSDLLPREIDNWLILADYDKDGRLDIFTDTSFGVKVIRNAGDSWEVLDGNLKANSNGNLVNIVVSGSDYPAIGDFDEDGDVDLLVFDFVVGDRIVLYQNISEENNLDDPLVFEKADTFWVYTAPMTFHTMTWNEAVAKAKPVSKKPWKRVVVLKKLNTWMLFKAYMYRHWWVGNHMTLRYHVFFRSIREVPTSSNVNRKGQKINYVDARDLSCWKIHDRLTLKWSPIGAANSTIKHTSNN